jgi:hypothetical protein
MEKKITTITPDDVSIDSLLSDLHMDKGHRLYGRIEEMYQEALKIAKPLALYMPIAPELHDGTISLNGVKLKEPFVYKMLSDNDTVIPYVSTCGLELEEWSQSFVDNMFEQFVADTMKEVFLDAVRDKLISEVQEKYFDAEKSISTINPGSLNEWPITGQRPLFEILGGVTGDIGVVLKDSLLMTPTKSVSGIIFQTDTAFHNCQLCPRVDCPGRTAPYEGD